MKIDAMIKHCMRRTANGYALRGLALGGKILLSSGDTNQTLHTEYAAHLQCCYLDLKSSSNNTRMMERLRNCLSKFPSQIVNRVTSPKYFR